MFRTEVFKPWKLSLFSKVHDDEILGSQRSANVCISLCLLFLLSYIENNKSQKQLFSKWKHAHYKINIPYKIQENI